MSRTTTKRQEVREASGLPEGAFEVAPDGTFLLWGAELVTDLTADEVRGQQDRVWIEIIAETMSHVEKQDLLVKWILVFYNEGRIHVEVESDRPFENWDTGEERRTEECSPCFDCRRTIQWAVPTRGHRDDCPFIIVHFVMTK